MFIDKKTFEIYKQISLVLILNFFILISGYIFNISVLIGGKLFYWILIPLGSINLIYSIFYFFNLKKRKITIEQFFKPNFFNIYQKNQKLIFIVVILLFIFIFTFPYIYVQGRLLIEDEESDLHTLVYGLTKNSTNETEKIHAILNWFNKDDTGPENFSNIYYRFDRNEVLLYFYDYTFYFEENPKICIRGGSEPYHIYISGSGRCGEYAHLFAEMSKIAGLNVSVVHCFGENHDWNEVYLENNETIIVDATAVKKPKSNGIMTSDFMQNKVAGDWRSLGDYPKEGNVSYVFYQFLNNPTKHDITERYTDTINLTINVTDTTGGPLKDVNVKIISHNRPDWIQKIGIYKTSNESGQCTFKIGGGRYKLSFQHNGDWFPVETDVKWFFEDNEKQYFNFEYKPYSIFDNPIHLMIILIIIIGGLSIGYYKFSYQKNK